MAFLLLILFGGIVQGQQKKPAVIADFSIPDTVCLGDPVVISNRSEGATTWLWNFCSGGVGKTPSGINFGNPLTLLKHPMYITMVKDLDDYYSFITNRTDGSIVRIHYGNNFLNPPSSVVKLGNFTYFNDSIYGIQVKNENGKWYGFVVNNSSLLRLDFGNSLLNMPSSTHLGPYGMYDRGQGLVIENDAGHWVGFCVSNYWNTLIRFDFINGLSDNPVVTSLGIVGGIFAPAQLALINDNGEWHMFVTNRSATISHIKFGTSLMNDSPDGINLGDVGFLEDNRGITMIDDCSRPHGFVVNHELSSNMLVRLNFEGGINGTVTGTSLGNIGDMLEPIAMSEIQRFHDTLYIYVVNYNNSTLTLLYFPACSLTDLPSSALENPPPVYYPAPGDYIITLTIDEGMPTQQVTCREVIVGDPVSVNLGNDRNVCTGNQFVLDAGTGYTSVQWNTGDTSHAITSDTAGKYWVDVTNQYHCTASDTIIITVIPSIISEIDTSLCTGQKYFAGGHWQSIPGIYRDTLSGTMGCDSIIITNLSFRDSIPRKLASDTMVCPWKQVTLEVVTPGATDYRWQDGSTGSVFTANEPGMFWVNITIAPCSRTDTIHLRTCSNLIFPNAFTPNGDGINDYFRSKGALPKNFLMMIYDRWGQLVFRSGNISIGWDGRFNNQPCPTGTYTYIVTYSDPENTGIERKMKGSFTLVR
ncbi:MAG: gliding motility-associated C-terminal domain-containing protein [Bacteroidetes bacterium]|nr:gliding motility-associated C-terminal domain-containing protein [Bacteroidota bacterium]